MCRGGQEPNGCPRVFPLGGPVLIPLAPKRAQADITKANCAGQGCPESAQCRRFRVRIGADWRVTTGLWASFDLQRAEAGGECVNFVRYIDPRRG